MLLEVVLAQAADDSTALASLTRWRLQHLRRECACKVGLGQRFYDVIPWLINYSLSYYIIDVIMTLRDVVGWLVGSGVPQKRGCESWTFLLGPSAPRGTSSSILDYKLKPDKGMNCNYIFVDNNNYTS